VHLATVSDARDPMTDKTAQLHYGGLFYFIFSLYMAVLRPPT
jgi:hypothetical protein